MTIALKFQEVPNKVINMRRLPLLLLPLSCRETRVYSSLYVLT